MCFTINLQSIACTLENVQSARLHVRLQMNRTYTALDVDIRDFVRCSLFYETFKTVASHSAIKR